MAYRRTERVIARLAARHEAIVAAARALAGEKGMSAVQIVPVAERAGIASGTVYRYFPSKEDLVAALVAATAEQEIAAIRGAVTAAPGPLSALAGRHPGLCRTCAPRSPARRGDARRTRRRGCGGRAPGLSPALAEELAGRIRTAIETGHLPDQDTTFAAAAVIGAVVEGLVGELSGAAETAEARHGAAQALTLFALRGLGVADARARGLVVQAR